jgi:hypothetical protein
MGNRGELLELRYRLDDGQGMGQVFERPTRLRGLARRAIALGRRTDVYVGCAPSTRRHGGRKAVEHAERRCRDRERLRRAAAELWEAATSPA